MAVLIHARERCGAVLRVNNVRGGRLRVDRRSGETQVWKGGGWPGDGLKGWVMDEVDRVHTPSSTNKGDSTTVKDK